MKKFLSFVILSSLSMANDHHQIDEKELDEINAISIKEFSFTNKTYLLGADITHRQVNTLSELFNEQTSIDVGGGGMMAQKIYIRGMEDRLLRVTIDGSAQNGNAFHHQGNTLIDPSMLKSIEIIKGSANASAGPGALAGSIAFITKDAYDFLKPNQNFGVKIGSSFFSNFGIKENIAIYGSNHKNFDILAYYDFQDIFYYRDGYHTFKNLFHPTNEDKVLGSASMQNNFLLKGNVYILEKDKITWNYNLIYDNATRPFRANIGNAIEEDGTHFAQQIFKHKNISHNFSLSHERKREIEFNQFGIKTTAYGSIRNVNLKPFNTLHQDGDSEGSTPRDIFLNNFGLDLNVSHTLNKDKRNAFEYGMNYQNMQVMDRNWKNPTKKQRGKEDANIIGAYVQANYYILDSLSFGAGTRYDSYFYYDKNSQNHHTFGFSPSATLIYEPTDTIDMKLSYAYVTRGALPGDALLLQDEHLIINPNLKSEKGQNLEFDIDYHHEDFALRGAVFYQNIKDFINTYGNGRAPIQLQPNARHAHEIVVRDNLKSLIHIYGFEAGMDYFYKDLSIGFSFSRSFPMVEGKLIADTYELGATTGNSYMIRISYDFKDSGLNLSYISKIIQRLKYTGYDIYNDEIESINKAGYNVHHIYLTYIPPKLKDFTFSFAIENLFNQYYINQASPFKVEADGSATEAINQIRKALPEPGLNAKISVAYRF